MSDLDWCTVCDKAISPFSKSLYCSEECLRNDALKTHPLLGFVYPVELQNFPRPSSSIPSIPSSSSMKSMISHASLGQHGSAGHRPRLGSTSSSISSDSSNSSVYSSSS